MSAPTRRILIHHPEEGRAVVELGVGDGSRAVSFALICTGGYVPQRPEAGSGLQQDGIREAVAELCARIQADPARARRRNSSEVTPWALSTHQREQTYDFVVAAPGCDFLGGADCYGDGSFLAAERIWQRLVWDGIDGIWAYLEGDFAIRFGEIPSSGSERGA